MKKEDAVKQFVERDFNSVPQSWVKTVMEHGDDISDYSPLPMWGTMWFVDSWMGEKLMENSRVMVGEYEEIDLEAIEDKKLRKTLKEAVEATQAENVSWGELSILQEYVDEEMAGARCVLDKEGSTTSVFIYEVGDEYVIGVNGAGWDFYHGVWDKLYDLMGLQWHTEEAK